MATKKILLNESEMPTHWYNVVADMPNQLLPSLHPVTKQPLALEDLTASFPMPIIMQEVTTERFIEIPDQVNDFYKLWRPTPLVRAFGLEKLLDTPAKIYYKNEGISPTGSHKANTAIPQVYYAKQEGAKKMVTETGAGQWGSALSFACALFGMDCEVFMVRVSYDQKPYRKTFMEIFGGDVCTSPSHRTQFGQSVLAQFPDHPGAIGMAGSEANERIMTGADSKRGFGSGLNSVMLHQTIVGQEALKQLEYAGDYPDVVIAPMGGGSSFAGISFPFLQLKLQGKRDVRCVAVEAASCPRMTKGVFCYDFGDVAGYSALIPMYTLGHNYKVPGIHAGGLRWHGTGPICSQLLKDGLIEAVAIQQLECFEAGLMFAKTEGIIPAPEATHAIAQVIREANQAKVEGKSRTILFNQCGHGHFDMQAYADFFEGKLVDHVFDEAALNLSLKEIEALQPV